jgi:hypothetical protein
MGDRRLTILVSVAVAGVLIAILGGRSGAETPRLGPAASQSQSLDTLRGQVQILERTNQDLARSLSQMEQRVAALGQRVEGQGRPQGGLADFTRKDQADWAKFQADVDRALEPELALLRKLEKHTHSYATPKGGWMKRQGLEACPDCLIFWRSQQGGEGSPASTSPPQM